MYVQGSNTYILEGLKADGVRDYGLDMAPPGVAAIAVHDERHMARDWPGLQHADERIAHKSRGHPAADE